MAISGKYGKVDIEHIGENEPVFIIRAQDTLAVQALENYQTLASINHAPAADGLKAEIDRFQTWDGSRKLPD
jgi:hypothetical protein